MKTVVCGGTFDHFHKGHKDFLHHFFSIGDEYIIGVTSDDFISVNKNANEIEPFSIRKEGLERFIDDQKKEIRTEIIEINDLFGPTLDKNRSIDVIMVSQQTQEGAGIINKKRKELGLSELEVSVVPLSYAEDRETISSSRIRNGEINREGRLWIHPSWKVRSGHITQELREVLGRPFGPLITNVDAWINNHNPKKVVTVGDVATKTFNELSFGQCLSIVDFHVARQKLHSNLQELGFLKDIDVISVENPPGSLTPQLFATVNDLFKKNREKRLVIQILGEEDLSVLPVLLRSPLGYTIVYGQPSIGMVDILVTEESKEKSYNIANSFVFDI